LYPIFMGALDITCFNSLYNAISSFYSVLNPPSKCRFCIKFMLDCELGNLNRKGFLEILEVLP
jgi:hypothetical protein